MKALYRYGVGLGILLVLAGSFGWAAANEKTGDVNFAFLTTLPEGKQLQAGPYRITLLNENTSPEVAFYKGKKLLCRCPVKLEDVSGRITQTEVMYERAANNNQLLKSILIKGWSQRIVFPSAAAAGPGR